MVLKFEIAQTVMLSYVETGMMRIVLRVVRASSFIVSL